LDSRFFIGNTLSRQEQDHPDKKQALIQSILIAPMTNTVAANPDGGENNRKSYSKACNEILPEICETGRVYADFSFCPLLYAEY
jgi:hypothetical protein